MKLAIAKRPDGFMEILEEHDFKHAQTLKPGEILEVIARKVRDPLNHRRYFVMHNLYYENQEKYNDPYICRKAIEMEAGYFEMVELHFKGESIKRKWPKSIAYDKLDETDFVIIKKKCGEIISEKLQLSKEDFEDEIESVIKLAFIN